MTYRANLRFERAVESPQVFFQVFAEDSTMLYQMQTRLGEAWRSFSAGEETNVAVSFLPRFGGGGTFRIVLVVTNTDTSSTLLQDRGGPAFFVPPRRGVTGVGDLEAVIMMDEENRTDHRSKRFRAKPALESS